MSALHLVRAGRVDALFPPLVPQLGKILAAPCVISPARLDPQFAFYPDRQQYHSSEIVARLHSLSFGAWRLLAITDVDLFIPILTFVFGEAEMEGRCALVSTYRLRQEFYGLDPDPAILAERLVKECVHEVGHTLGLTHCDDYSCAMAASHSVEWIDLKGSAFCQTCQQAARPMIAAAGATE